IPFWGQRPRPTTVSAFDAALPESLHSDERRVNGSATERVKVSPTETVDAANDAKKDGVKREISVEIPAAEVSREMEIIVQKYQKVARLPGFRTGHVPASIIKQRFKEDLKSDVVEALVPRY